MEDFLRYIQSAGFHELHRTSHKCEFERLASELVAFVAEFSPGTPVQDDILIHLSTKRKEVRSAICDPANRDPVKLQRLAFRHVALNAAIQKAQKFEQE